ncbi:MAG: hypothetical protein OXT67_00700 [Zetaproteobacteria bacterium]|nr:hypothetical protein [Zetaproteobacteria bacterium]
MSTHPVQLALKLVWMHMCALRRRLLHKLLETIVTLFSSAVIAALFVYVAADFANQKLAMAAPFYGFYVGWGFTCITSIGLTWWLGKEAGPFVDPQHPFYLYWQSRGLPPQVLTHARCLQLLLLLLLLYLPLQGGILRVMAPDPYHPLSIAVLLLSTGVMISWVLYHSTTSAHRSPQTLRHTYHSLPQSSPPRILIRWRLLQSVYNQRPGRILAWVVSGLLFSTPFLWASYQPFAVLLALTSGVIGSCGCLYSYLQGLKLAWMEKQTGLSHSQFYLSLLCTHLLAAGAASVCMLLGYGCTAAYTGELPELRAYVIPLASGWVPFLVAPQLFFHLRHNNFMVYILANTLLSLFWATAVYAVWWTLLIFPFVIQYGYQSQQDRFYTC